MGGFGRWGGWCIDGDGLGVGVGGVWEWGGRGGEVGLEVGKEGLREFLGLKRWG